MQDPIYLKLAQIGNDSTIMYLLISGDNTFDFTCLLHTYIRVADVTKVSVSGLKGLSYVDKVRGSTITHCSFSYIDSVHMGKIRCVTTTILTCHL